jgi:hypothetical protein
LSTNKNQNEKRNTKTWITGKKAKKLSKKKENLEKLQEGTSRKEGLKN